MIIGAEREHARRRRGPRTNAGHDHRETVSRGDAYGGVMRKGLHPSQLCWSFPVGMPTAVATPRDLIGVSQRYEEKNDRGVRGSDKTIPRWP